MHIRSFPRRLACAAFIAAALVPAAAAEADTGAAEDRCDVRLEQLEAQFYAMADRRSYEDASEWWGARWQAYHTSCVMH